MSLPFWCEHIEERMPFIPVKAYPSAWSFMRREYYLKIGDAADFEKGRFICGRVLFCPFCGVRRPGSVDVSVML